MQSPTLVFDHINKVVTAVQPGPTQDEQLSEVLAVQREQVTSASGLPTTRD